MDLEVSKVSNIRRKVIFFWFLKDSKPLRKLISFSIYWICNSYKLSGTVLLLCVIRLYVGKLTSFMQLFRYFVSRGFGTDFN